MEPIEQIKKLANDHKLEIRPVKNSRYAYQVITPKNNYVRFIGTAADIEIWLQGYGAGSDDCIDIAFP